MIETVIDSIRATLITQHRVLFLREVGGERHLPIWIGEFEASAIVLEMQGTTPQRPLPYDLMTSMLTDLDARVVRVVINDLSRDIYYARIVIERAGQIVEIDSRPSDAIAIAVRAQCQIFVDDAVMDRAGVNIADDEQIEIETAAESGEREVIGQTEEELTLFRDFINTIDLEDPDARNN